jgi:hypothetical protein
MLSITFLVCTHNVQIRVITSINRNHSLKNKLGTLLGRWQARVHLAELQL